MLPAQVGGCLEQNTLKNDKCWKKIKLPFVYRHLLVRVTVVGRKVYLRIDPNFKTLVVDDTIGQK